MSATMKWEDVALLVRLGAEAGGRVDPARIARRRPDAPSRLAFDWAQREGLLDSDGWVTDAGYVAAGIAPQHASDDSRKRSGA